MRWERDYYTQAKKRIDEIERKAEEKRLSMTAEELEKRQSREAEILQQLYDEDKKRLRRYRSVFSVEKYRRFRDMARLAVRLAQCYYLNVCIDMDYEGVGRIRWTTDRILVNKRWRQSGKLVNKLFTESDSFSIKTEDQMICIEFSFELCKQILVEQNRRGKERAGSTQAR